jgi:hypothetical protein
VSQFFMKIHFLANPGPRSLLNNVKIAGWMY